MSEHTGSEINIITEYNAIVSYHTSIVQSRFTIAGLFAAAFAVLIKTEFETNITIHAKIAICIIGFWLTICAWILELRSRCLYSNVAHRGIEIEHNNWKLLDKNWYSGFFSRQYKEEPTPLEFTKSIPKKPDPDRVKVSLIFWNRPLVFCKIASNFISHSRGFDLLYFGSLMIWVVLFIIAIIWKMRH